MGDRKIAMLHVKKQLQLIKKNQSDLCISVGLIDDDLFRWRICFQGPQSTPFQGGIYQATLTFPDDFPHMPPKMIFITQMFHPNIYPNGQVCISILHPPFQDPMNPQQRVQQKWNPILTIQAIILISPNLDSPANVDAAKLLKENLKEFNKKTRYLARKSIGDI